jgi:hypothetical protein
MDSTNESQPEPQQQEKIYKTPAYIRKAVKAYTLRQKEQNYQQFTERKRGYDKKYYQKFKKTDSLENDSKDSS